MTPVFADAGYWIALLFKADALHRTALRVTASLGNRRIVTSEAVLTELLDGAADQGTYLRTLAVQYVRDLRADETLLIVPMSHDLFTSAFALYSPRMDKGWSLTDCASMVICRQEGITDVLAHDRHFEQAGFRALLRENP